MSGTNKGAFRQWGNRDGGFNQRDKGGFGVSDDWDQVIWCAAEGISLMGFG